MLSKRQEAREIMTGIDGMTDGERQAARVQEEAQGWTNTGVVQPPREGDLPVVDLLEFTQNEPGSLMRLAEKLRDAFDRTGFFVLVTHGCESAISATLETAKRFHSELSTEDKERLAFGSRCEISLASLI